MLGHTLCSILSDPVTCSAFAPWPSRMLCPPSCVQWPTFGNCISHFLALCFPSGIIWPRQNCRSKREQERSERYVTHGCWPPPSGSRTVYPTASIQHHLPPARSQLSLLTLSEEEKQPPALASLPAALLNPTHTAYRILLSHLPRAPSACAACFLSRPSRHAAERPRSVASLLS